MQSDFNVTDKNHEIMLELLHR